MQGHLKEKEESSLKIITLLKRRMQSDIDKLEKRCISQHGHKSSCDTQQLQQHGFREMEVDDNRSQVTSIADKQQPYAYADHH